MDLDHVKQKARENPNAAILIVLLIIVVIYLLWKHSTAGAERFNQNYIYDSGQKQAKLFSEFSSSNQAEFTSGRNDFVLAAEEVDAIHAQAAAAARASKSDHDTKPDATTENLTSSTEEPELWAVGRDISMYRNAIIGQTPGLNPNRYKIPIERIHEGDPRNDVYEYLLQDQIYSGV